ncbi:phospholipase A2 inhibitor and Ly6/PLAUR domain-containing protein-like [Mixophyes fleayi]|uniref:phospholipase A2 inhibitor and Ly6/PLAUR domain-containing protein-like n=1 Tax=Mixophyes fleayi TaxID=3061075 RepID=UPI003F4D7F78
MAQLALTFVKCLLARCHRRNGYSLKCISCQSYSSTSCTGTTTVECPAGNACGYVYAEASEGGLKTRVLIRSCIIENQCNTSGSITYYSGKSKTATSCCSTDNCAPLPLKIPADSTEKNKLVCRSCLKANANWCYTSDTMECTGDETKCILQTSKTSAGSVALRGCATKSICDQGSQSTAAGEVKVWCTDGSSNLQHTSYISGLFALLLIKLLS